MLDSIKKLWVKNKAIFLVVSGILFVAVGLTNFFFIFNVTAQSNDECLWEEKRITRDSVAIFFNQVKVNGVTWDAGIRNGDQLIAIDGIKAHNNLIATRVLDKIHSGDYAIYTVKRGNDIFEVNVTVKKLINFSGLAFSLLSFLWLVTSLIVVMAKPDGKTQNIFYRVGLLSVLFALSNLLYRGRMVENPIFENITILISVETLMSFGGFFFPFALIHFFTVFPKEYSFALKKWFVPVLYGIPYSLFIATTIIKIKFVFIDRLDSVYSILNNIINLLIFIGFITGFILLFINYLKLKTRRERNSIFVILISYLVGVIAIVYTNFLAEEIAGIIFNRPAYFMPIILIALLPISFGYSILRYSLMDVSIVVKNTIIYGTATVMLAGIYFLLMYFIGQSISTAIGTEYQGIIAGVIFVAFAMLFQSTKDRFQDILTEKFYPEQFTFQKSLLKFSGDITGIVGFDNIIDANVNLFIQSLKIDRFGLMLKNNENVYKIIRQKGFFNSDIKIHDELNEIEMYFWSQEQLGKKTYVERQDFKNLVFGKFSVLLDEEIYTVIPLIIKSNVIGLLLFGLKHSGSQFSGKDIDLLLSAAGQTAISLENSRLYASEAEKKKIENDLENARKIQESLLPKTFPTIKKLSICGKMIPAMHIGGDYFDLIKINESKLFVVVGDVSGKGLSASFYMSKLQTMIRLYCNENSTPKQILSEINKRIFNEIEKNSFITVLLALIDTEKEEIKLCRAGHTPLIKFNNTTYELYQPSGIGLGLDKSEIFQSSLEEQTIQLYKNDLLFFFSDGITELMNNDSELYGIQRLKSIIQINIKSNCKDISKLLLEDIQLFRKDTPQYDDITFVIINYNS